eukprot:6008227-Lingulodinium_polyedra.AAC.1
MATPTPYTAVHITRTCLHAYIHNWHRATTTTDPTDLARGVSPNVHTCASLIPTVPASGGPPMVSNRLCGSLASWITYSTRSTLQTWPSWGWRVA